VSTGFPPTINPGGFDAGIFAEFSEDELYGVIGTGFVTPTQGFTAVARAYGNSELIGQLDAAGLVIAPTDNLVDLGRRAVKRLINDLHEDVRRELCLRWHQWKNQGADVRTLADGILLLLLGAAVHPFGIPLLAIAYLLAKFGLAKICEPAGMVASPV
jgi:hypothetical protein